MSLPVIHRIEWDTRGRWWFYHNSPQPDQRFGFLRVLGLCVTYTTDSRYCKWILDQNHNWYTTECLNYYAAPCEKRANFCPYCGRKLSGSRPKLVVDTSEGIL